MTQLPEFKNYTHVTLLAAYRNVDQVLSKSMAELLHGAGFIQSFKALEQARSSNVEACAKALREAGMNDLYIEQAVAQNFAEAFEHYWPDLQLRINDSMNYVFPTRTAA